MIEIVVSQLCSSWRTAHTDWHGSDRNAFHSEPISPPFCRTQHRRVRRNLSRPLFWYNPSFPILVLSTPSVTSSRTSFIQTKPHRFFEHTNLNFPFRCTDFADISS